MIYNKMRHSLLLIALFFVFISMLIAGCSQIKTQTTSTSSTAVTTTANVPTITAPDAYTLIQHNLNNPGFIVIDVRTLTEFNAGHIAGAINIDYESPQFTADVSKLDKNKQYLVYCATGIRGAAATQIMTSLGFKYVQNMAGGITAWMQAGYPITQPATTASTTTSVQSTDGLQLQVAVNATSLTPGENLQISVGEYNTLTTANSVSSGKNWGVSGLSLGACSNTYVQPFGVALYQGHYTAQNISQATSLEIYARVPCPNYIRMITGYDFLPDSINAAVMPGGDVSSPTSMSANVIVGGIYTQVTQLTPLVSGDYTVVAGDEWGALEFLYIIVK
jgi:rhodanese-related sulfurtransferase